MEDKAVRPKLHESAFICAICLLDRPKLDMAVKSFKPESCEVQASEVTLGLRVVMSFCDASLKGIEALKVEGREYPVGDNVWDIALSVLNVALVYVQTGLAGKMQETAVNNKLSLEVLTRSFRRDNFPLDILLQNTNPLDVILEHAFITHRNQINEKALYLPTTYWIKVLSSMGWGRSLDIIMHPSEIESRDSLFSYVKQNILRLEDLQKLEFPEEVLTVFTKSYREGQGQDASNMIEMATPSLDAYLPIKGITNIIKQFLWASNSQTKAVAQEASSSPAPSQSPFSR